MENTNVNFSRRQWMTAMGGCAVAALMIPWNQAMAAGAVDWNSLQGTDSVPPGETADATMTRLYGQRPIEYSEDKLKFTAPNVAENGAVVPSDVELVAPMADGVYVKRITWIVDKNKRPQTVVFDFTPETGSGYAAAYLRMGQTSWVRAILEFSDGTLLGAKKEVKVVTGGCGG